MNFSPACIWTCNSESQKGNCARAIAISDRAHLAITLRNKRAANASSAKPLNATRIILSETSTADIDTMNISRIDPKRRANLDYKKRQFANPEFQQQNYDQRLSFYTLPPTAEITLEEFETWAIDRLKGIKMDHCHMRVCVN
jgi:hypothetical protein